MRMKQLPSSLKLHVNHCNLLSKTQLCCPMQAQTANRIVIRLSPFSTPSTTISSCHSATLYARHPEHEADAPEEEEEEEEEEEDDDLDEIEIDSGHPPGDEENF
ncbi:hypothetical protein FOXB_11341 [Fusarium oxysporum f. sp. conglutinans Fo5176]|uniref:Uncharacterized protein n=1 Tax=Fusarium oxysporum (strain Fo5176) TaxID=660025 RepID=F9FY59_FUSOF|nr:hypothetical protein FOXB_11341 [Fusarium oxysporum f. sp. conglutinans Fo5176]